MSLQNVLKKKLSTRFQRTVMGIALLFATGCNSGSGIHTDPTTDTASLTAGEDSLAHSIFGNEVNTKIVIKCFKPEYRSDAAAWNNTPQEIDFWGAKYFSADYSKEYSLNFGCFVHEMTHIWQRQNHLLKDSVAVYQYPLEAKYCFNDYGSEQQASIIQDYALRFLHPDHKSYWMPDSPENDLLLQKVVEDMFPAARKTRLAYEAREQAAQQAKVRAAKVSL